MFKHSFDQFQKGSNFNQQFKQLTEILKKALGISPQLWTDNAKKEIPDFVALQKIAEQGPYGELLKQFNNGLIMMGIIEQYLLAITDKINELKKEIEELEDEDIDEDKSKDDGGKAPAEKKEELVAQKIEIVNQKQNINKQYRYYRAQYALLLVKFVRAIEHFVAHVAVPAIHKHAEELGYRFNAKEAAMIESAVPRSVLEEKLKDSYRKAQEAELAALKKVAATTSNIPDAPAPPPLPAIHRDFPKTEDFMARSLMDLEMRTLMALNANWNRQFNEMHDPSQRSEHTAQTNLNGAKSVTEARKMAQESAHPAPESPAMQNLKAKHRVSQTFDAQALEKGLQAEQQAEKRSRRDSRVLYSVQDSLSLLKEFNATFKDLETRFKTLTDLHKDEIEKIPQKMRELIDKEKTTNKTADKASTASPTLVK